MFSSLNGWKNEIVLNQFLEYPLDIPLIQIMVFKGNDSMKICLMYWTIEITNKTNLCTFNKIYNVNITYSNLTYDIKLFL